MIGINKKPSPAQYNKAPRGNQGGNQGVPQASAGSANKYSQQKSKKIFGLDYRLVLGGLAVLLFLLVGVGAILVVQKQRAEKKPVAPTAPEKPKAAVQPEGCNLTFTVLEPSPTVTATVSPTATLTPTATASPSATPTATATPIPDACGYTPCEDYEDGTNSCDEGLDCVTNTVTGDNYCAMSEYADICTDTDSPGTAACCEAPPTPTNTGVPLLPTPTFIAVTPNPTEPPQPGEPTSPPTYTVVTTVQCNDTCTVNADCANISHICYNGRCRLDSNPEDENCRTSSGGETVVVQQQQLTQRLAEPTTPPELPETGVMDVLNYAKVGLGILGVGLLLLLLF